MRDSIINAHQFLASLKVGDPVLVHRDGRDLTLTVQRPLRRADEPYGSTEGSRVTVGYGPGRWNTEVTVEALASDPTILERPPVVTLVYPHHWSPSGARCTRCPVVGTGDSENDGDCAAHPDYPHPMRPTTPLTTSDEPRP